MTARPGARARSGVRPAEAPGGPLRIGELATEMAVSAPTVSHIVDAHEGVGDVR
jgi:hypothetical protein